MVKYSESNNMYENMKRCYGLGRSRRKWAIEIKRLGYTIILHSATTPYWHGLFGGIYLARLRQAVYENYFIAEGIAEEALDCYKGSRGISVYSVDFDHDGAKEILVETKNLDLYFKPGDVGALFELDFKVKELEHNVQDTMTRYPEPYLEGTGFKPDWYRRVSLRVYLWSPQTGISDWILSEQSMERSDLALKDFYPLVDSGTVAKL